VNVSGQQQVARVDLAALNLPEDRGWIDVLGEGEVVPENGILEAPLRPYQAAWLTPHRHGE
jgi:hypothetical protein